MSIHIETEVALDEREPRRIAQLFERFGRENRLPEQMVQRVQLALDEVVTNVVNYAFPDDAQDAEIRVGIRLDDERLRIRVEDNGAPFDPLSEAEEPELDLEADLRPVGGLGIHFAKVFVHTLEYEYVDGRNRLTFIQPIDATPKENDT